MNNNIINTKKKLTIIFSIIVFFVVLTLGIIFFSFKYYREVSLEKKEFSNLVQIVNSGKISINDIINYGIIGEEKRDKNKLKNNYKLIIPDPDFKPRGFINYLLINLNGEIVSSNIKDDIDKSLITKIINTNNFNIKQTGTFLIKKFSYNKNNQSFIILKKLRYSLYDYLNDLFGFTIIGLLFGIFIYFIGGRFVNKAFIPVESNIKDMENFIHNAGHELKTPISVIDSNIQIIDDMKIYDENMTKELKIELIRLNSIIDSLIKLSEIALFKSLEQNNLNDNVEQILKDFKSKIYEKKIKLNINIDKNILIESNKDYFYIFLSNIIGNAIKYNKKGGNINISYNNGELIISDSGIGISKEDITKIFNRFFKVDKSRSSEGFGIGLSLVKKIGDIYNWNIIVKSNEVNGVDFIIKF